MTYEYTCTNCNYDWTTEQKITENALTECPNCKEQSAKRLVSGGVGFQLKGSGWFKSGGY